VLDALVQYGGPRIEPLAAYNVNYRCRHLLRDVRVIRGDVRDKVELRRHVALLRPECVIHLAAVPVVGLAARHTEEAFETIVGGTVNLLEIYRDIDPPPRLVYVSSCLVYGDFPQGGVTEDYPTRPKEFYGGLKLAGEIAVRSYHQQFGLPYTIVRPDAVYGPTDNHHRVINAFLKNAIAGEPLCACNADGMRLDFTYVDDAAEAIKLAATLPQAVGETFHVTRGRARSLREAAAVVCSLYPGTRVQYVRGEPSRSVRGTADVSKARTLLGYRPRYDLEEGLAEYARYLEAAMGSEGRRPLRAAA
jgi:nucleoside-diphosphate-sugar epimerase